MSGFRKRVETLRQQLERVRTSEIRLRLTDEDGNKVAYLFDPEKKVLMELWEKEIEVIERLMLESQGGEETCTRAGK